MYARTPDKGGRWKEKDNAILEVGPNGQQFIRFRPVSALATPEFIKRLCTLYHQATDRREAERLIDRLFIFDLSAPSLLGRQRRIGRLLTLMLLYQAGYEVGRYISLERIVDESKETYYEVLLKSSHGWHEAKHDLRPWWNYFLGTLIAAYREFEERVGTITTAKGAKREMVQQAVKRLPNRFRIAELQRVCPGVSYPTLKRALEDLKRQKKVRCLGKGRDAQWERIGSWSC
jgi:Fic family protein